MSTDTGRIVEKPSSNFITMAKFYIMCHCFASAAPTTCSPIMLKPIGIADMN
jgi:hypothetical protein